MIDHVGFKVSDLDRSREFYERALAPLGYRLIMSHPISGAGFGAGRKPTFWISPGSPVAGLHIAITAADARAVQAFHRAAIDAGGRDNGAPGPRPEYHPGYYGAFVLDPDGYNIEAVLHSWRAD